MRRLPDALFVLLLAAALLVRVPAAATRGFVHDEENTAIPLSRLISFDPAAPNLPLRAVNHGALPAYVVKASSSLFGTSPLGYRAGSIILALLTITLVFFLTRPLYGAWAGLWASAIVGFNAYYLDVSSRATAHAPYLFFVALALFAASRFLSLARARHLFLAAVATALAFYCKEHAALVLVALGLMFLRPGWRPWLRRSAPYAACALFVLLIAPDVAWNAAADAETDRVTYGNRDAPQATYARHLQRIGGLGVSPYPLMFYGRSAVIPAYQRVTGRTLDDNTSEYRSMHPLLGILLLGSVAYALSAGRPGHDAGRFLLLYFCLVFGGFSLIRPGNPDGLDPVSWIWVDATMIPAAVMAGAALSTASGAIARRAANRRSR